MIQLPPDTAPLEVWGAFLKGVGWAGGLLMAGFGVLWKLMASAKSHGNGNGNGNGYAVGGDLRQILSAVGQLIESGTETRESNARAWQAIERHEAKANEILAGVSMGLSGIARAVDRIEDLLGKEPVAALRGRRRTGKHDRRHK